MTRRMLGATALAVAAAAMAAAPARAAFEVPEFSLTPSSTKAGANADVTIVAGFTPYPSALSPVPEQPRRVVFHLPPGLAGDPFATPKCTEAQYQAAACPARTQVGEVAVAGQDARRPCPPTRAAASSTSCRRDRSPRGSARSCSPTSAARRCSSRP